MIEKIARPEGMGFALSTKNKTYFALTDDKGLFAYICVDIRREEALIHAKMLRWSVSVRKEMEKDWSEVLMFCIRNDVKRLAAVNDDYKDKRWAKFIKIFGFSKPTVYAVSERDL